LVLYQDSLVGEAVPSGSREVSSSLHPFNTYFIIVGSVKLLLLKIIPVVTRSWLEEQKFAVIGTTTCKSSRSSLRFRPSNHCSLQALYV